MRTRICLCEKDARLRKSTNRILFVLSGDFCCNLLSLASNKKLIVLHCVCFRYFQSRVLNRPGGTCQISLGGYTEAELERMRKNREAKINSSAAAAANANTGTENEKKATTNEKPSPEPSKKKEASPVVEKVIAEQPVTSNTLPSVRRNAHVSSNAFASSSTTNSFNVLTSRPTSRVSNQPGGRSNFTLG
jgi:hypothetical protein